MASWAVADMTEWNSLSEPLQLQLAAAALREASENLASYAEALASEMESGFMSDRGGHEALRLFANIVRAVHAAEPAGAGHAWAGDLDKTTPTQALSRERERVCWTVISRGVSRSGLRRSGAGRRGAHGAPPP